MNSNNVTGVKIGYYFMFLLLICTMIAMVVLYYKFIYNKKLGTAFKTHLENTLTSDNMVHDHLLNVDNIIDPPFIEVYKKNISNEKELLSNNKYLSKFDDLELLGIKVLGVLLFIILIFLYKQESIEDITVESVSLFGRLNVITFVAIIFILCAIVISVYLLYKFFKMRKILNIKSDDTDIEKLFLRQGLLYEKLDTILPKHFKEKQEGNEKTYLEIINDMINEYNVGKEDKIDLEINKENGNPKLTKFYTDNKDKNLPAPFNGGDNNYATVYKNTANIGTFISLSSLILSLISLIIIYKRGK